MAGAPYRIVYLRGDGQRFYYAREIEHTVNGASGTLPRVEDDARQARKFGTVTEAVARRDALRQMYSKERFFIESCSGGDPLFENRSNEVGRTEAPADRGNMQCNGILIVPASLNRWAIRFPQSNFESIYAATPDEAYQGYLRAIALRPEMAEYVEKYQPPEMSDAEFAARIAQAQRAVNQARFGPGQRRPGNNR